MVDLKFGIGEISSSKENIIIANQKKVNCFDYLLFFDSRALTIKQSNIDVPILVKIENILQDSSKSFLGISRPKNLTIFATLVNFLELNPTLEFDILITNLGFVDCTPKKQKNVDDILLQIKQFNDIENIIVEHEPYMLNSENIEILKSIEYSKEYMVELNSVFNERFENCYFINTPIISEEMKMNRKRPKSFFKQLYKTNELINNLLALNVEKNILVDIKDLNYTYDGVHYTKEGHAKIFNKIKESIEL